MQVEFRIGSSGNNLPLIFPISVLMIGFATSTIAVKNPDLPLILYFTPEFVISLNLISCLEISSLKAYSSFII